MDQDFTVPAEWYRTFFTAPVNAFWEAVVPEAATAADLAFLRRHIAPPPACLLDLPCGAGRHSLALARAGHRVTGVDISADAIARARAAGEGLAVEFVEADMRDFQSPSAFDAVLCLGNSLAYFPPEEVAEFVRQLAAALRPGGTLILDTYCCAESLFPLAEEREICFDGGSYHAALRYDTAHSRLDTRAELHVGGAAHQLLYSHHIVTSGALVGMVTRAGLRLQGLYAATDDTPYAPGSPRLLLVAVAP
ncbi:MAG: class I SAM-dependent methyltransferase [Alphaproteobacteria bacterium]|nr:class I SAM-dependent methyltransferase [Alphaproteobacteria bacterium]